MHDVGEVEHASNNKSDTNKSGVVSTTVITAQGNVNIYKNNVVNIPTIPVARTRAPVVW